MCLVPDDDPADKKKYHDDDAMWNHAENALREVLTELGIHFTEEIGEAAFYGPKLDVNVKPAVGAEYTLSTCQLDFCLPAKFHLTYVDKDGSEKTPVVLHRAILGSLDRFMAYLIEETKGKFPTWLAPVQVKVLPVSEKTLEYAESITEKLVEAGVRVALDDDNQKIGYKIRAAQQVDRVPYMLVLGAKEAEAGNLSVRDARARPLPWKWMNSSQRSPRRSRPAHTTTKTYAKIITARPFSRTGRGPRCLYLERCMER